LSAVKEAEKCSVRVEDNIGLVHACARRYTGKGIEYEDLVQVGCIGLIKAAKGFDETRLVRFSTYAVPVILGEIKGVFRSGGAVRVSRSIKELGMRAQKLSDEIYLASGTRPKLSELSERLGADIEELTEAVCAMQMPLSVDAEDWVDIPQQSFENDLTESVALSQAIGALDSRSRSIIMLRYFGGLTQSATAQRLGMTQVQVSRAESKAVGKLREKLT